MYLRPRQIFEKFLVAEKFNRLNARGQQSVEFVPTGEEVFCVVTNANLKEMERLKTLHHEVTHALAQRHGHAKAKVGDMLIGGMRKFLIQATDNPAGVGFWIVYFCKERFDL